MKSIPLYDTQDAISAVEIKDIPLDHHVAIKDGKIIYSDKDPNKVQSIAAANMAVMRFADGSLYLFSVIVFD